MFRAVVPMSQPTCTAARSQLVCRHCLEEGVAHLEVVGELDVAGEPYFAASLDRCLTKAAVLVVDVRALEFLSCGGLRSLLNAARRARARGGRLVVVRGPGAVQRLFDLVGVALELELVDRPPERVRLPRSWRSAAA